MLSRATIQNLPNNNRFYILVFSVLLSVFIFCALRAAIPSDQLFYIRTEQSFGFIAIIFLYAALIISPVQKVVGEREGVKNLLFARRAIGVSAAYFALLHTVIALWGQIGGPEGFAMLPERFIWALTYGAVALTVLLLMAATSFDKVIKFMTFRKWKWLHRLVYLGSVLIILHVWMIGTHMAYGWIQVAAFIPLCILFGLETWTIVSTFTKTHPRARQYFLSLVIGLWLALSAVLYMLPALVRNYHSEHHADGGSSDHSGSSRDGHE